MFPWHSRQPSPSACPPHPPPHLPPLPGDLEIHDFINVLRVHKSNVTFCIDEGLYNLLRADNYSLFAP